MKLPYRNALVTGASSGIGEGFARLLAKEGLNLVIVARRSNRLRVLAKELIGQYSVDVEVIACDLALDDDVLFVEKRLADASRPIDLLVNNAGFGTTGEFADLELDREIQEVAVNVTAPLRLIHAVLPQLIARGCGGIVNVSSMTGSIPLPRSATYGATKAFLTAFSENLHMEVRRRGIHVTSIGTGLTRTEFHEVAGTPVDGLPKLAWMQPERVARAGLAAVAANRVHVVPGLMNRVPLPALRLLPRPVIRAAVRRFYNV